MQQYVIGIDGGGTKTQAVAYSLTGEKLAMHIGGASNLANGYDSSVHHINECISNVLQPGTLVRIALGIAGVKGGTFATDLVQYLQQQYSGVSVELDNDVVFAHRALFHGGDGLLVSAGTGSIAIYKQQSEDYCLLGGWGHLLGDQGSGYDLAITLYRYCTYCDDYQIDSPLVQRFYTINGYESSRDFVPFIYNSVKKDIAEAALFLAQAATNGDKIAQHLIQQCAKNFATYIIEALQARKVTQLPVQFFGSVILQNEHYYPTIVACFEQAGFTVLPKPDDVEITTAVLYKIT
ncbi:MAG: N-acetylglucosamine kinase [Culicoidibacterales bacterium]